MKKFGSLLLLFILLLGTANETLLGQIIGDGLHSLNSTLDQNGEEKVTVVHWWKIEVMQNDWYEIDPYYYETIAFDSTDNPKKWLDIGLNVTSYFGANNQFFTGWADYHYDYIPFCGVFTFYFMTLKDSTSVDYIHPIEIEEYMSLDAEVIEPADSS